MNIKFILFKSERYDDTTSPWLIRNVANEPKEGELIFFKEDEVLIEERGKEFHDAYLPGLYKVVPSEYSGNAYAVRVQDPSILIL